VKRRRSPETGFLASRCRARGREWDPRIIPYAARPPRLPRCGPRRTPPGSGWASRPSSRRCRLRSGSDHVGSDCIVEAAVFPRRRSAKLIKRSPNLPCCQGSTANEGRRVRLSETTQNDAKAYALSAVRRCADYTLTFATRPPEHRVQAGALTRMTSAVSKNKSPTLARRLVEVHLPRRSNPDHLPTRTPRSPRVRAPAARRPGSRCRLPWGRCRSTRPACPLPRPAA
jgi:hypothetical protein